MLVARHTAGLSRPDRAAVDVEIAPQLQRLGTRRVAGAAKRIAYRLDPHGYVTRLAHAECGRYVSCAQRQTAWCT